MCHPVIDPTKIEVKREEEKTPAEREAELRRIETVAVQIVPPERITALRAEAVRFAAGAEAHAAQIEAREGLDRMQAHGPTELRSPNLNPAPQPSDNALRLRASFARQPQRTPSPEKFVQDLAKRYGEQFRVFFEEIVGEPGLQERIASAIRSYGNSIGVYFQDALVAARAHGDSADVQRIEAALREAGVSPETVLHILDEFESLFAAEHPDRQKINEIGAALVTELKKFQTAMEKSGVALKDSWRYLASYAGMARFLSDRLAIMGRGERVRAYYDGSRANDLAVRLDSIEIQPFKSLHIQIEAVDAVKGKLQHEVDLAAERIQEYEKELVALEIDNEALEAKLATASEAEKEEIDQKLRQNRAREQKLKNDIVTERKHVENHPKRIRAQDAELTSLQKELASHLAAREKINWNVLREGPAKEGKFKMWADAIAEARSQLDNSPLKEAERKEIQGKLKRLGENVDAKFDHLVRALRGKFEVGALDDLVKRGWELARDLTDLQLAIANLLTVTGTASAGLAPIRMMLQMTLASLAGYLSNLLLVRSRFHVEKI